MKVQKKFLQSKKFIRLDYSIKTNLNSTKRKSEKPWYSDGLNFKCTGCGKCCRWPGQVFCSEQVSLSCTIYNIFLLTN